VTLQGIIPDPEGWLRAMHNGWTIIPDRTFLFVLPVDAALTRLKPDAQREHFEKRETLERVQNNYLAFARNEPSRFVIIDAMLSPEIVAGFVADGIRELVVGGKKRKGRKK
jgi:dTMP kinase